MRCNLCGFAPGDMIDKAKDIKSLCGLAEMMSCTCDDVSEQPGWAYIQVLNGFDHHGVKIAVGLHSLKILPCALK